jgi:hypothetical protein
VFAFLSEQVQLTKRAHEEARRAYWELVRYPGDLPAGDTVNDQRESDWYRKTMSYERLTLNSHIEAMSRLNRYLKDGAIPEDVRERLVKTKAAAAAA